MLQIGHHAHRDELNFADLAAIITAQDESFAPVFQIFISNPQGHGLLKEPKMVDGYHVIAHGSYIDNPWNGASGAIHNIKEEMKHAAEMGITGLIIHLGNVTDEVCERLFHHLNKLDAVVLHRVILYFETNAARADPNKTFETPCKIADLIIKLEAHCGAVKCGICIDTAHLYANGVSFESARDTHEWFQELLRKIPESYPIMIHLNDSSCELGSGKDKHVPITTGKIWHKFAAIAGKRPLGQSGIAVIVHFAKKHRWPIILERHNNHDHIAELRLIKKLI